VKRQEALLNDLAFVSITLSAGQIGTITLFRTNLVASNWSYYFTHPIAQIEPLDHEIFTTLLESLLASLQDGNIQVGTIICDVARLQIKA
jgi:hypothetical protein